jgi:hypothetical protein
MPAWRVWGNSRAMMAMGNRAFISVRICRNIAVMTS